RAFEASWLPALRPGWWRLRRILRAAYDFQTHKVRPSWSRVLTWLCEEHAARAAVEELESEARQGFGIEEPLGDFLESLARLRKDGEAWPVVVRDLHRHCLDSSDGRQCISTLCQLKPLLEKFQGETRGVLEDFDDLTIAGLRQELGAIGAALQGLP